MEGVIFLLEKSDTFHLTKWLNFTSQVMSQIGIMHLPPPCTESNIIHAALR